MADERERLEAAAQERWGDAWFIEHHIDSDGDEQWYAEHTTDRLADGLVIRESIRMTDDGPTPIYRAVVDTKEYVTKVPDGLDRDTLLDLLEYEP